MSMLNTDRSYGAITKFFHWLTALLIVTLIPLGIFANDLPYDTSEQLARKAFYFSIHKTLGVTTFFVALGRILWALTQPKPAPLHPKRRLETFAAETVHWLLYGSLLLVPLSGWVHHAATTGFAPIWWPFGQSLPYVPKSESLASLAAGLHIVFERVLIISIILHVAGALKHQGIDRDATLRRMWPGNSTEAGSDAPHHVFLPLIAALAVWASAVGIGSALELYDEHDTPVAAAALEDVQSDWTVQDGTLAITVVQMGSDVRGEFADWTAAITFDETVTEGLAGSVDVTIAIGSLTLGSVTGQAMGADFFNAENYPTAAFTADIIAGPDGYTADGTVTIKGQSLPATLPFKLSVTDGVAQMTGSTTLDRRRFGIGDNQTDPASLQFDVAVSVELTASKGE